MHMHFDPNQAANTLTDFETFLSIDIRVGTVVEAHSVSDLKRPACRLFIDFGEGVGRKRSVAQITQNHRPDDLIGQKILAVVNFAPRQIGRYMSDVLVLGVADEQGHISLIKPSHDVPNGARLA